MGNDPETSREKADEESVECPEHKARRRVESGVGKLDVFWGEERVEEVRALVDGANDGKVHHTDGQMSMARDDTSNNAIRGGHLHVGPGPERRPLVAVRPFGQVVSVGLSDCIY